MRRTTVRDKPLAKGPRSIWTGILVLATTALWLGTAGAVTGHGGEHGPSLSDLIYPAINFVLFVFLLRWAANGSLRDYLLQRREEILSALKNASAAKEAAIRAYDEARAQLAHVDDEATQLRSDMRSVARAERDRRLKLATEIATRISEDARLVAGQEERTARNVLREETVRAAVAETIALLRRQIKSGDQDRFLEEFAAEVQAQP